MRWPGLPGVLWPVALARSAGFPAALAG